MSNLESNGNGITRLVIEFFKKSSIILSMPEKAKCTEVVRSIFIELGLIHPSRAEKLRRAGAGLHFEGWSQNTPKLSEPHPVFVRHR